MNDYLIYKLAEQRRNDLYASAHRRMLAREAGLRRWRLLRAARPVCARTLRRLADRIEPAPRRAGALRLPVQRHLV
jgi:hypothetical protein